MGEYAPYVISATDRSGLLVIVATLFMSWMVIVCLIRLYMRLGMNGPIRIDDVVVFSGGVSRSLLLQQLWAKFYDVSTWQAFGIAHVGTIMHGVSHGLGRSQNETSASDQKSAAQVNATCNPSMKSNTADSIITPLDSVCCQYFIPCRPRCCESLRWIPPAPARPGEGVSAGVQSHFSCDGAVDDRLNTSHCNQLHGSIPVVQ